MADISDVENVLVSTLTQAIYPNGTGEPSIINSPCRIPYRGWPAPSALDQDLAAGMVNVTVFPQDNEQNVTRYQPRWYPLPVSSPALTLSVSGNTITVGGAVSSPLNAAAIVNGVAHVYAVQPGDTLTSIAAALAALINQNIPATSSGPVITIDDSVPAVPGVYLQESGPLSSRFGGALLPSMAGFWSIKGLSLKVGKAWKKRFGGAVLPSIAACWPTPSVGIVARVGAVGSAVQELKRQKRSFQITFWCPTLALRDAIVAPCDAALAALTWLSLPDGTAARLRSQKTFVTDRAEKQALFRRDLIYSVEYGTTQLQTAAQVVAQMFNISGGVDPSAPAIETFSI